MRTKLDPFSLAILGAFFFWHVDTGAANADSPAALEVPELISQLGDAQYVLRQRAETQLLERGAKVFDALQAAASHADLEISTRAKYLLNQIRIDWDRPTDLPIVRSIMVDYGKSTQHSKLAKVAKLANLEQEQGFAALCRIARFESSGLPARYAALAILEKGFVPTARIAAAVTALSKEMGEEKRGKGDEVPVSWIRTYADQLQSPQQIDPRWLTLIDKEIAQFPEEASPTSHAQLLTLLNSYLNICDQLSDAEAMMAGWQRRIDLGNSISEVLLRALTWLTDREQWEALRLLEDRYADPIQDQRLLLYLVAVARDQQGRPSDAEEVAKQAFQLAESSDPFAETNAQQRNQCAHLLGEFGRHDWAEREWRHVIDTEDVTELEAMKARQSLGLFVLHDRLEHKAAADLLTETIDAIDVDPVVKRQYRSDPRLWGRLQLLRAHREYFLAAHFRAKDTKKQRRHLEQAYQLDADNADVLIAMYHVTDSGTAYRKLTRLRIKKSLQKVEAEIKKSKKDPHWYNHWAWLISNTEGDFAKAVRYSQRSLELEPGNPSYLDTLGRCYFAAGDLKNAIQVEREAVAKHPHLRVMRRQLKQFENALQRRLDGNIAQ